MTRNKQKINNNRTEHTKGNNNEKKSSNDKYKSNDLLLKEFDQAWNHYRHIEDQRSKNMNYFYTIILGITVVFINYFKDKNLQLSVGVCIGISMLLLSLFVYSFFTYTAVRKASVVLKHYENVMQIIRKLYYEDESQLTTLYIRDTMKKSIFSKFFSVQNTSEMILIGTMLMILVIEFLIFIFFYQITNSVTQLRYIYYFIIFSMSILIYIIIQDRFSKKN